jgi:diacylglycerol kinase (ATP)
VTHIALVGNPTSGAGRAAALLAPVTQRLRARGHEVTVLQANDAQDADRQCRQAVQDGVDALVALGGDGMVHLALQAVAGTSTALGIIPAGTGNDFARHLGLPSDPLEAADVVARAERRTVDACLSEGRWWCNILGSGFDSCVNERANRLRWPAGRRRYDRAILGELRTFRPVPFTLELDGVRTEIEAMMVAVANAPSYGGGLRMAPDACVDDGLLDVVVIGPLSRLTLVRMLPRLSSGRHVSHPSVSVSRARRVCLAAPGQVAYADGERFAALPLCTEVVAGALTVLV